MSDEPQGSGGQDLEVDYEEEAAPSYAPAGDAADEEREESGAGGIPAGEAAAVDEVPEWQQTDIPDEWRPLPIFRVRPSAPWGVSA